MGAQEPGLAWFLGMLINLGLPALVWATVTTGLILIVREKTEDTPRKQCTLRAEDIVTGCCYRQENPRSGTPNETDQAMPVSPIRCQS